jgi:hypothetical protein
LSRLRVGRDRAEAGFARFLLRVLGRELVSRRKAEIPPIILAVLDRRFPHMVVEVLQLPPVSCTLPKVSA